MTLLTYHESIDRFDIAERPDNPKSDHVLRVDCIWRPRPPRPRLRYHRQSALKITMTGREASRQKPTSQEPTSTTSSSQAEPRCGSTSEGSTCCTQRKGDSYLPRKHGAVPQVSTCSNILLRGHSMLRVMTCGPPVRQGCRRLQDSQREIGGKQRWKRVGLAQ